MTDYTTKEGDMADQLCFRKYRRYRHSDVLAFFEANPDLTHENYRLPAGVDVTFPTPSVRAPVEDLTTFWSVPGV